jgi:hypothetical protein
MSSEPRPPATPEKSAGRTNEKLKKAIADDLDNLRRRVSKLRIDEHHRTKTITSLDRRTKRFTEQRDRHDAQVASRENNREEVKATNAKVAADVAQRRIFAKIDVDDARAEAEDRRRDVADEQKRMRRIYECERNLQREAEREKTLQRHSTVRIATMGVRDRTYRASARRIQAVRSKLQHDVEVDEMERDEQLAAMRKLRKEEERLRGHISQLDDTCEGKHLTLEQISGVSSRPPSQRSPRVHHASPPPSRGKQRSAKSPDAENDDPMNDDGTLPPVN